MIHQRAVPVLQSAALAVLISAIHVQAQPAAELTERLSISSSEVQANHLSARRGRPVVNFDGVVAAFDSLASNLVAGDTNVVDDIFVRDRAAGTTERVSVSTAGAQGNGQSVRPSISDDGLMVAFESEATNLVAGDTNGETDILVRDRVCVSSAGVQGNDLSINPTISADGGFVVFSSDATNLVSDKTTLFRDIYVRDLAAGTTERVSLSHAGAEAAGNSFVASISGDGRYVAFSSLAANLVAGDVNGQPDIFLRDRLMGTTVLVSVSTAGDQTNGSSIIPVISADGQYVVFASEASNLVADDTNGVQDVFVRDLVAQTTERVSLTDDDQQADGQSVGPGVRGGAVFGAVISADGRFVAFDSVASNLVAGDTNTCEAATVIFSEPGTCPDIFVRDRLLGTTQRFSIDSTGVQADHASTDPGISGNGLTAVFFSLASNLVEADTNTCSIPPILFFDDPGECPDIFAHDSPLTPEPPGGCPEGTVAECSDTDNDGIRDDNCTWWDCIANECQGTAIVFAEMGGAFGGCPPDGAADANDRFHALNCFANTDTTGAVGYPCEAAPPQAFNVDAGGAFGDCNPDGVCDANDAFHALNAFSGTSPCSCPPDGPAPQRRGSRAPR
jgi:Tol biopolymer transport system component